MHVIKLFIYFNLYILLYITVLNANLVFYQTYSNKYYFNVFVDRIFLLCPQLAS